MTAKLKQRDLPGGPVRLRLHASNVVAAGLIPGWGTKTSRGVQHSQNNGHTMFQAEL